MKVLRLHGAADLRLHEEPCPTPGPGESLLRVQTVGICGSDIHWLEDGGIGGATLTRPLILGHEFAGQLPDGALVAADPAINCGDCEYCREGAPNLCDALAFAGHAPTDGALREWVSWPTRLLHPLPPGMTAAEGALLEPLGIALHAVDLAALRPGATVAVLGCGPIGLLLVQLAHIAGAARILATDVLPHRLELARRFGAEPFHAREGSGELPALLSATGGRGVDVAFEAAGDHDAVATATGIARKGGSVILIGIPGDDRTTFTAAVARRKELTFKLVRRMRHTYPRAIALVAAGRVNLRALITARFPLRDYAKAFDVAQRREGVKVIVEL